jgi:ankyrin repeat protein
MHGVGRLRLTVLVQKSRRTALHWASAGGHVSCVRLLLERGAGVDVVDVSSWLVVRTHGMAWA